MQSNLHELKNIVLSFRNQIEAAWTEESAYKVPEIIHYGPFISGGQCAVTSLVLKDKLEQEYPDLQIYLAGGYVEKDNSTIIGSHNWLKIGKGESAIIIDPTIDQANEVNEKIIVETAQDLRDKGIVYIETELESNHGEQLHPKRYQRYLILKKNFDTLSAKK